MFQSTPAPKSGRNISRHRSYQAASRFNPRPLRRAGETITLKPIRTRKRSFNPRPLRRAGETLSDELDTLPETFVSIHARSEERAKLYLFNGSEYVTDVSIHARSEERAKLEPDLYQAVLRGFQSTPAPKSGRNEGFCAYRLIRYGFNPRPLRRAGETNRKGKYRVCPTTFQSTPAPKSGRNGVGTDGLIYDLVSIHARSEERAKQHGAV